MEPDDVFFIPEQIDEQIDRIGEQEHTPEGRLLSDMQTMFTADFVSDSDFAAAWQRIEQARKHVTGQAPIEEKQASRLPTPHDLQGVIHMEFDNYPHDSQAVETIAAPHGQAAPARPRRSWIAAVAALLVVLMGAAVFALHPHHGPSQKPGDGETHPSAPHNRWTELPKLRYQVTGSTSPAIAPSNPNVVYEAVQVGNGIMLRRTDDGGGTWHELPFPLAKGGEYDRRELDLYVNPLDPKVVYMMIYNTSAQTCPPGTVENNPEFGQLCFVQFVSTDSGNHWQLEHLPDDGYFYMPSSALNAQAIRVQGNRLYMMLVCKDSACQHIVSSTDGGLTWSVVDSQISNSSITTCNFAVSPTGSTIFAVLTTNYCDGRSTQTLWESDDAGQHWQRNAQLPRGELNGMAATAGSDAAHPLLYLYYAPVIGDSTNKLEGDTPIYSLAATDFEVSADGGKTWQHAPQQGVPSNQDAALLLGVLADGSMVGEFTPHSAANTASGLGYAENAIFIWKAGAPSWKQLGATLTRYIFTLVDAPGSAPYGKVYLLAEVTDPNSFEGQVFLYQP
jgi:hypothetical protein